MRGVGRLSTLCFGWRALILRETSLFALSTGDCLAVGLALSAVSQVALPPLMRILSLGD